MDLFSNIDWGEWGPPLAVIALGLIAGFALASRLRGGDAAVTDQTRRLDLDNERKAALEALRALESEAGKLTPEDYTLEREALVARGAAAMRVLEEGDAVGAETATPAMERLLALQTELGDDALRAAIAGVYGGEPAPTGALAPEWRGALSALAVVALIGGLLGYANSNSVDRRPGASMTGNQDLGGTTDRKVELEARVTAQPNDLEAINELTILSIQGGDAPAAMEWNRKAFELDPNDPTARTWKAVLAAAVGMEDRALEMLNEVVEESPEHAEAWTYKGIIELRGGRAADAVVSLERSVALEPGNPQLQGALAQARQLAAAAGGGPAAPPAPTGPAEVVVSGVAELSPAIQDALSGSETLYVSLRNPAGGPPLAAKRMPMGDWPAAFEVTTADAIAMGGAPRPFPPTLRLIVTIDADGNPMSKDDVVATVSVDDVARGATDLTVSLIPPG
ncbi:MAG: tetratricopeptide (TPR) repeat protein [Myxococcota bacterium]|jgi:tetratricopeptide (TPR) repeat protein